MEVYNNSMDGYSNVTSTYSTNNTDVNDVVKAAMSYVTYKIGK